MNNASAQGLKQAFAKKQEKTTITVDSGGYEFDVPSPADLVPLKKELKTLAGYMKKQAPGNQVHEIYAPKGSTEKSFINKGLYRNCDVQTIKALANQDLDAKSFKQVKSLFNRQFESLMKKVLSDMKDNTGLTIKTKEKVGSGTFIDNDSQYAYLFYAQVADGMGNKVDRVSAACVFYKEGKIILANIHSNLNSEKDATWVKTTAKNWLNSIKKANK